MIYGCLPIYYIGRHPYIMIIRKRRAFWSQIGSCLTYTLCIGWDAVLNIFSLESCMGLEKNLAGTGKTSLDIRLQTLASACQDLWIETQKIMSSHFTWLLKMVTFPSSAIPLNSFTSLYFHSSSSSYAPVSILPFAREDNQRNEAPQVVHAYLNMTLQTNLVMVNNYDISLMITAASVWLGNADKTWARIVKCPSLSAMNSDTRLSSHIC